MYPYRLVTMIIIFGNSSRVCYRKWKILIMIRYSLFLSGFCFRQWLSVISQFLDFASVICQILYLANDELSANVQNFFVDVPYFCWRALLSDEDLQRVMIATSMFVTDVGDDVCWWLVWEVGDDFRHIKYYFGASAVSTNIQMDIGFQNKPLKTNSATTLKLPTSQCH